ncbi:trace amine-associated receptor 13c-like [Clarias gariepinus]
MNVTEFQQSDRCLHFSCPDRSVSSAFYIILYLCSTAVVLMTVCGNMFVIISVFHFKQLHTPSNMLVLSLAVVDFLICAFVMLPMLISSIESCWIFGRGLCIVFLLIARFLAFLGIYNVTLIAVDRYFALSKPFLYTDSVSVRKMCIVVYSNCCLCMVYMVAFFYFSGSITNSIICPGQCFYFYNKFWTLIDLVILFVFPCFLIIILYTQVFIIAKKHATAIRQLHNYTRTKTQTIISDSMKSERKAAKVLGIIVSMFLACLLPYYIYNLLGDFIEKQPETFNGLVFLCYLNGTINPIIYALFYPWFRRCIKLIITLQIFQKESELLNVLS